MEKEFDFESIMKIDTKSPQGYSELIKKLLSFCSAKFGMQSSIGIIQEIHWQHEAYIQHEMLENMIKANVIINKN